MIRGLVLRVLQRASRLVSVAIVLGFLSYGAMRWYAALVVRFAPVL